MESKIKPIGDNVFVVRYEDEGRTRGGIVIPDSAKKKSCRGKVVAVGPGLYEKNQRNPLYVKPGDEIVFSQYAGIETKVGDTDYFCVHEVDILCVVRGVDVEN